MDVKPISDIKNRRDFHDAFQAAMSGAHETLRTLWHFEKEQNLPKSYLIEFHPTHSRDHSNGWTHEAVFSALLSSARQYGGELHRTDDDSLLWLDHYEGNNSAQFIVDCLNPRFLVFHTISNAEQSDRFILERLTQYQPEFDLFWFPVDLLERTETRERITGWEAQFLPLIDFDFSSDGLHRPPGEESKLAEDAEADLDEVSPQPPARLLRRPRLNIDVEYQRAFETYKKLKQQPDLLPDMPLNAVLAERVDEDATSYARARITSNGKITGRGPDFSSYLQVVNGALDDYARVVETLESKYWIRFDARDSGESLALRLNGEPFCIGFSREIDVRALLGLMFDCRRPFRLMGEFEEVAEKYYSVNAIDLHVNQPVSFEIAPTFIRVYLYEGVCGNTLVRIIRSLQHHVDSKLRHPPLVVE